MSRQAAPTKNIDCIRPSGSTSASDYARILREESEKGFCELAAAAARRAAATDLDIRLVEEDPNTLHVTLEGELDATTAAWFNDTIGRFLGRDDQTVSLDMEGLAFIDSMGIGMLASLGNKLRLRGGMLKIVSVSRTVYRTLAMSGLQSFVQLPTPRASWLDRLRDRLAG